MCDQIQGVVSVNAPVRMVVIKIHNPLAPTPQLLSYVRELLSIHGPVRQIVLSTVALEHKATFGPFAQYFPDATVWIHFPIQLQIEYLGVVQGNDKLLILPRIPVPFYHSRDSIFDDVVELYRRPDDSMRRAGRRGVLRHGAIPGGLLYPWPWHEGDVDIANFDVISQGRTLFCPPILTKLILDRDPECAQEWIASWDGSISVIPGHLNNYVKADRREFAMAFDPLRSNAGRPGGQAYPQRALPQGFGVAAGGIGRANAIRHSRSKSRLRFGIRTTESLDPIRVRIISLGDVGTGKSCLIKRYCESRFTSKSIPMIGIDYGTPLTSRKMNDGRQLEVKMDFFDLSDVRNEFYKNVNGALVTFDITSNRSFESLGKWLREASRYGLSSDTMTTMLVVGNKIDHHLCEVTEQEGVAFSIQNNATYFETSAKTGMGIDDMFEYLLRELTCDEERRQSSKLP
ncbi:LOW QUALITY PROTEIN: hypothetical protein ACHAXA_003407 [Cyclostephanos tholiformis]|uniref:Ras family protein n=1 Tax=Cyclostephanos tholiformis TaxID=382380 RepID=A0ABD3RGH3_9STRA